MAAPRRVVDTGNYHVYLLRLTRAGADQPWEMVAKDVETGEEFPLSGPDALIAFLTGRVPMLEEQQSRHQH